LKYVFLTLFLIPSAIFLIKLRKKGLKILAATYIAVGLFLAFIIWILSDGGFLGRSSDNFLLKWFILWIKDFLCTGGFSLWLFPLSLFYEAGAKMRVFFGFISGGIGLIALSVFLSTKGRDIDDREKYLYQ